MSWLIRSILPLLLGCALAWSLCSGRGASPSAARLLRDDRTILQFRHGERAIPPTSARCRFPPAASSPASREPTNHGRPSPRPVARFAPSIRKARTGRRALPANVLAAIPAIVPGNSWCDSSARSRNVRIPHSRHQTSRPRTRLRRGRYQPPSNSSEPSHTPKSPGSGS
jgi:hypothetical protein